MFITNLPEELIYIIVSYLDTISVKNLYDTNRYLRSIIIHVVRKCDISFTAIPAGKFLESSFYNNISAQLVELNMCGVWGLNKTSLMPGLRTLKCIKTLDVSYTNIGIDDLLDIHKKCDSITDISIDFKFSSKYDPAMMTEYQELFGKFQNVHFINDFIGEKFNLALHFLKTSRYNKLKFSHITVGARQYLRIRRLSTSFTRLTFNELSFIHYGNSKYNYHPSYPSDRISSIIELCQYAAIGFEYYDSPYKIKFCLINASPMFVGFLKKIFKGEKRISIESWNKRKMCRLCSLNIANNNSVIMAWNKDTTQFDDSFYHNLTKMLNTHVDTYRGSQRRVVGL